MHIFSRVITGILILVFSVEWVRVIFFNLPLSSRRIFRGDWGWQYIVHTPLGKILFTLGYGVLIFLAIALWLKREKPEEKCNILKSERKVSE